VQVFFMEQKFIEEVRGFSLLALEQKIEQGKPNCTSLCFCPHIGSGK
jgi:hypothetical protein